MNQPEATLDPRRWLALAVILSATLLGVLDFLIVNIAVPSIRADLHATDAEIQLTIAGYGLAYAVCLVTGGRLGDIYGRKKMFLWGMGGFTLASALCGLAQTPMQLVAFRIIQGLLASLMSPQVLAIIQVTFAGRERDTATGAMGAVVGVGSFIGNVFGGWLVGANIFNLGWRPIFFVNVPIGIIAMVCAWFWVRESKAEKAQKLDIPGALLCGVALFCLIFPLAEGRERGWPAWAFVMMVASTLLAWVFVRYERGVAARDGSPLIDMNLFQEKPFARGLCGVFLLFSGMGSFALTLTIFLQDGLGQTPQRTGLIFAPLAVAFLLASLSAVKLTQRMGTKVLALGLSVALVGQFWMLGLLLAFHGSLNPLWLMPPMFVYGIGQGLTVPRLIRSTMNTIEGHHAGAAAGVLSTVQQIAFAVGVSIVGSIFFSLLGSSGHASRDVYTRAWAVALGCNILSFGLTRIIVMRLLPATHPDKDVLPEAVCVETA
ncbi:MAG TPA: MFS transporter [Abditibacteriaceae bacterium]|jgi:EmrB/QacA subfamily drug resistance transporter